MHFGKKLLAKRHPPWAQYYLDYAFLKNILEQDYVDIMKYKLPPSNARSLMSQLSMLSTQSLRQSMRDTTLAFQCELDNQVRRVVLFFLLMQGLIASRITQIVKVSANHNNAQSLPSRRER